MSAPKPEYSAQSNCFTRNGASSIFLPFLEFKSCISSAFRHLTSVVSNSQSRRCCRQAIAEAKVSRIKSAFLRWWSAQVKWPSLILGTGIVVLSQGSCGGSHAILVLTGPSNVVAGQPFSMTVTAMYQSQRDTAIDGPIHFTTSDSAASLPTLYIFTSADAGSHTFSGLSLVTPGQQTITVSDYDATPIAGTMNIMVAASP